MPVASLVAGAIMFAHVSWSLFGSNMYADYQQDRMRDRLAAATAAAPVVDEGVTAGAAEASETTLLALAPELVEVSGFTPPADAVPAPQMPAQGEAAASMRIPKIGVDTVVAAGTDVQTLKGGPGIWLHGVMPGEVGNATISGHRTTYGGPFRHLDALAPGDRIEVDVPGQPLAVFEVRASFIVSPDDVGVTHQTDGVRLTLTTCDPVGSDAQRLIVQAELVEGAQVANALPAGEWSPQQ